ncbi:MAG: hypothetical protein ACLTC4_17560 [Hungatella hathewayi]
MPIREVAEIQGNPAVRSGKAREKRRRETHFQTAGFGGFEESQVICFLWTL